MRRMVRATEQTAFHDAPSFSLGFEPLPGKGMKAVLADSTGKIRAIFVGQPPAWLDRIHFGKIDATRALDIVRSILDCFAIDLWQKIASGGSLGPRDLVMLKNWTAYRAPCGFKMKAEDAQRLFGDAPNVLELSPSSIGTELLIEWEGPQRVLGTDADYMRRKECAQAKFHEAVADAEERFIGACYIAFLRSFNRTSEDEPS